MNIKLKLALPVLIGLAIIDATIRYYWEPLQLEKAKQSYEAQTVALLDESGIVLVRDLLENDFASLFSNLEHLEKNHEERWFNLMFFGEGGKRLYPLFEPRTNGEMADRELMHVRHQLDIEGTVLGYLTVSVDWGAEKRDVLESIRGVKNMVLMLIVLALLFSIAGQYNFIYRPLSQLRRVTDKVASGEYDVELPAASSDEIGDLTKSFKSMMVELRFQKYALDQHAIVSITDRKGIITYANQKFIDISGYSHDELMGKNHRIIKSDVHSPDFFREMWTTIAGGEIWHGEFCNHNKKGEKYWVNSTIVPFMGNSNRPEHYISIRTDITKRKLAEMALQEARLEAESANRAKSQFLSGMSHELRTPMNAIMGFSQIMKMDKKHPLSESQLENLEEIINAGDHLMGLIDEVLDLARIEAGRIDLNIEAVAPGDVIAESLNLIMPLARKRGIGITVMSNGEELLLEQLSLQGATVRVDRVRLKQVLLNLLSNAVKYNSENGNITISCIDTGSNRMRIHVRDTGNGLSPKQQEDLFTPFSRLGAEYSEIEGTGIGLVIAKNMVELMGGSIGVESQLGEGSTFWIEFPTDRTASGHEKKQNLSSVEEEQVVNRAQRGYSVLYIEDNPANLRLVSRTLSLMPQIHMWSAHEPLLGIELAMEHSPDLILLDINLPGMNGYEVLKILKEREVTRNTTVIAISANAMPADIEKGREAGFDDYLTKPIDIQLLMKAVDKALQDNEER